MYTRGESYGASSGFGLWAKTLAGAIIIIMNTDRLFSWR